MFTHHSVPVHHIGIGTHNSCSPLFSSGEQNFPNPLVSIQIITYFLLIAPVQPTLRTVPGRVIALESAAKRFVALTMPDGLNGFLENVADHPLLLVFARASMSEGGKTTREHIAARCNIGQRVGSLAASPGTLAKIAYQAFYGCRGTSCVEEDAAFLTCLCAALYQIQFFLRGSAEQGLFR